MAINNNNASVKNNKGNALNDNDRINTNVNIKIKMGDDKPKRKPKRKSNQISTPPDDGLAPKPMGGAYVPSTSTYDTSYPSFRPTFQSQATPIATPAPVITPAPATTTPAPIPTRPPVPPPPPPPPPPIVTATPSVVRPPVPPPPPPPPPPPVTTTQQAPTTVRKPPPAPITIPTPIINESPYGGIIPIVPLSAPPSPAPVRPLSAPPMAAPRRQLSAPPSPAPVRGSSLPQIVERGATPPVERPLSKERTVTPPILPVLPPQTQDLYRQIAQETAFKQQYASLVEKDITGTLTNSEDRRYKDELEAMLNPDVISEIRRKVYNDLNTPPPAIVKERTPTPPVVPQFRTPTPEPPPKERTATPPMAVIRERTRTPQPPVITEEIPSRSSTEMSGAETKTPTAQRQELKKIEEEANKDVERKIKELEDFEKQYSDIFTNIEGFKKVIKETNDKTKKVVNKILTDSKIKDDQERQMKLNEQLLEIKKRRARSIINKFVSNEYRRIAKNQLEQKLVEEGLQNLEDRIYYMEKLNEKALVTKQFKDIRDKLIENKKTRKEALKTIQSVANRAKLRGKYIEFKNLINEAKSDEDRGAIIDNFLGIPAIKKGFSFMGALGGAAKVIGGVAKGAVSLVTEAQANAKLLAEKKLEELKAEEEKLLREKAIMTIQSKMKRKLSENEAVKLIDKQLEEEKKKASIATTGVYGVWGALKGFVAGKESRELSSTERLQIVRGQIDDFKVILKYRPLNEEQRNEFFDLLKKEEQLRNFVEGETPVAKKETPKKEKTPPPPVSAPVEEPPPPVEEGEGSAVRTKKALKGQEGGRWSKYQAKYSEMNDNFDDIYNTIKNDKTFMESLKKDKQKQKSLNSKITAIKEEKKYRYRKQIEVERLSPLIKKLLESEGLL